ncbi:HAD family hydrolase [Balneatrix alpica]|uniref:HAD family hydrolase n=1 Tax=Balneatrix alpica TaxID=75684 RepID=UPI002738857B|nr:HAD-IA family hydrolase [Balneatrix alpica]
MQQSIKLVIFDWDGTLMNSGQRIHDCMAAAIAEVGLPVPDSQAILSRIGLGLPEYLMDLLPQASEQERQQVRQHYVDYFIAAEQQPSPLFSGAEQVLEQLQQAGLSLAVATGKSRRGLNRVFAKTGLDRYFAYSRCADETASKPDPLMLYQLLEVAQVQASEAVMVGDTSYDMAMAQAAAMPRVAVTYGVHDVARLSAYQLDGVLEDIRALPHWLSTRGVKV